MFSSEEKLKINKKLIMQSADNVNSDDVQRQLHDYLMKETGNGKLYKYRTVKKHSLNCLKNGTMYCATPDSFNDPFDSKIGFAFKPLLEAKSGGEIDYIAVVFSHFLLVYYGFAEISDYDEQEQRIISELLKSESIISFVENNKDIITSEEEQENYILENASGLVELLQAFLKVNDGGNVLGITSSMLPKIQEGITPYGSITLSENEQSFSEFAKSFGVTEDADEIDLTMLLNKKLFPENSESNQKAKKSILKIEQDLINKMNALFKIGCLATDYKNRLMWSHYADSHKGFCVEYDFRKTDENTMSILPLPVVYSDKRPQVPWKHFFDNNSDNNAEINFAIISSFLTKDNAWEYENEWRIIAQNSESAFIEMPPITCIYLGANMSEEDKDKIVKIAKDKNIPVKQMTIDRGEFLLHAKDL